MTRFTCDSRNGSIASVVQMLHVAVESGCILPHRRHCPGSPSQGEKLDWEPRSPSPWRSFVIPCGPTPRIRPIWAFNSRRLHTPSASRGPAMHFCFCSNGQDGYKGPAMAIYLLPPISSIPLTPRQARIIHLAQHCQSCLPCQCICDCNKSLQYQPCRRELS